MITASIDGFDVNLELFGHVPGDGEADDPRHRLWRIGLLPVQPVAANSASALRLRRLRSCGSRNRLRSRILFGVTSTSSSSVM